MILQGEDAALLAKAAIIILDGFGRRMVPLSSRLQAGSGQESYHTVLNGIEDWQLRRSPYGGAQLRECFAFFKTVLLVLDLPVMLCNVLDMDAG